MSLSPCPFNHKVIGQGEREKLMKKEIRLVDNKRGIVQITTHDERFYAEPSTNKETGLPEYKFVPSVTWIAGYYPKGIQFYKWLADKGWDEAEAIKNAAGDKGSRVHRAIVSLIDGASIEMGSMQPNADGVDEELTVEDWDCLNSFVRWFKEAKPKVLEREVVVITDNYAGTVDFVCEIGEEKWLIDFKTSQNVWPEYELQVSAYKHAGYEDCKLGILQIGYKRNKNEYKFNEVEDKFPLFLAAKQIWSNENDEVYPKQKDYPLSLSLKVVEEETKPIKTKPIKTKPIKTKPIKTKKNESKQKS